MPRLIDAHGPDHGLSVALNGDSVEIREWFESPSDHDQNSGVCGILSATVALNDLFGNGPHRGSYSGDSGKPCPFDHEADDYRDEAVAQNPKHAVAVINAAIAWLAFGAVEEEVFQWGEKPCQHFGNLWGLHQQKATRANPDRFRCAECGGTPE